MKNCRVILFMLVAVAAAGMALHAQVSPSQFRWLAPGADMVLPRELIGLGVPSAAVKVQIVNDVRQPDGINDPWSRKITLSVRP
jgi:hypothetical protein